METLFDSSGNHYELKDKNQRSPIRGVRSFYLKPACNKVMKDDNGREWQVSLIDLSVQLTSKQMQTFLRMCLLTDSYNIIYGGLNKVMNDIGIHDRHQLSKMKSALFAAKAIVQSPIGNIMVNPFVSLPAGVEGFYAQQIWKRINYDNDAYFEGIVETVNSLGW